MSNIVKTIENPEVPGLECLLPPPPPPPPPIISDAVVAKAPIIPANSDEPIDTAVSETIVSKTIPETIKIGSADADLTSGATSGQIQSSAKTSSNNAKSFVSESTPLFAGGIQTPYFIPPAVPPIPSGEQPWWVPTDSDTAEVGATNRTWFDPNPWADNNQKVVSPTGKSKGKFFKRKSECIDPAQDAERVANAQRELSALMKPLKCDLCNAIMNSTLQAKLHYEGKPHQKKVSMFLNQSVKKIKPDDGQVTSTTSSADWNTYCDVCKTWFTSQIDASQHYAGKKHIRATTGATKQKTKKQPNQTPVDPTGRFGIGIPFSNEPQATILGGPELAVATPIVPPVMPSVPTNTYQASAWPFPAFRCELCGVTANRLEQLETHKRGAKHMKMMKMNGIAKTEVDEINDSTAQPVSSAIDYSIYRTPSGQYYCAPCNRSFHSENSFAQHVESKKHKTQVNPKQAVPPPAVSKKTNKSK